MILVPGASPRKSTSCAKRRRKWRPWRTAACSAAAIVAGFSAGVCAAAARNSSVVLAGYYGNSLVCRNEKTRAICHVWLDADGRYYAFYDLGAQGRPAGIHGPFEIEGREGRYTLRGRSGTFQVCLHPNPPMKIGAEQARELFSRAACYPLAIHRVGDEWEIGWHGQRYTLWLLAGR